jgi:hypothetical protein
VSGAVAMAHHELAAEFLTDMRRLDEQMRDSKKRLAAAVRAAGTTVTEVFGVGPVIAATVIAGVIDVARFPSRDHFAACNGTAPVEVSSGNRAIYRLSRRGNRRLNHVLHMAAVTQIRHRRSDGRAYYDRKIAEGKTSKEALRALKRRISDAIFVRLLADARQATAAAAVTGPGGQPGNGSDASAAGSHPEHRLFGQATPGPRTSVRRTTRTKAPDPQPEPQETPTTPLDNKEASIWCRSRPRCIADSCAQSRVICVSPCGRSCRKSCVSLAHSDADQRISLHDCLDRSRIPRKSTSLRCLAKRLSARSDRC